MLFCPTMLICDQCPHCVLGSVLNRSNGGGVWGGGRYNAELLLRLRWEG